MVILNLKGGMGNQMFQYAAAYNLSRKLDCGLIFDCRDLLDRNPRSDITFRDFQLLNFGIPISQASVGLLMKVGLPFSSKRLRDYSLSLLGRISTCVIRERKYGSNFFNIQRCKNIYLDGYWQSEDYFIDSALNMRNIFSIHDNHDMHILDLAHEIDSTTSVCINIRRTDYLNHTYLDVVGIDYYLKAYDLLRNVLNFEPRVYIFSDDVEWSRENVKISLNQMVVDERFYGKDYFSKFMLMTKCSHFIIPNSSYAWWAAWLGRSPNKVVIAPKIWSNDESFDSSKVTPSDWIRI